MRNIFDYILKNKEWIFSGIGVLLLSAFFWLIRGTLRRTIARKKSVSDSEAATKDLRGVITIPLESGKSYEVFYPRKFQTPPFLKVEFISGQIGIDVIEQRSDGFRFSTHGGGYASSGGVKVEWIAEGEFVAAAQQLIPADRS